MENNCVKSDLIVGSGTLAGGIIGLTGYMHFVTNNPGLTITLSEPGSAISWVAGKAVVGCLGVGAGYFVSTLIDEKRKQRKKDK